jgi:hypothetical protein
MPLKAGHFSEYAKYFSGEYAALDADNITTTSNVYRRKAKSPWL